MRLLLSYRRTSRSPFPKSLLCVIAEETLRVAEMLPKMVDTVALNAIAVSSEEIRALNRTYRKKDAETDILSFGEFSDQEAIRNISGRTVFLGELYFSPAFIGKSARENRIAPVHEFIYVFSHGLLHLLGFDHGRKMFGLQDAVTAHLVRLQTVITPKQTIL